MVEVNIALFEFKLLFFELNKEITKLQASRPELETLANIEKILWIILQSWFKRGTFRSWVSTNLCYHLCYHLKFRHTTLINKSVSSSLLYQPKISNLVSYWLQIMRKHKKKYTSTGLPSPFHRKYGRHYHIYLVIVVCYPVVQSGVAW